MFGKGLKKIINRYNVNYSNIMGTHQLLDINHEDLMTIIDAYDKGRENFVIDGNTYYFGGCLGLDIYTFEPTKEMNGEQLYKTAERNGMLTIQSFTDPIVSKEVLGKVGNRVTGNFIKTVFGAKASTTKTNLLNYVDETRIKQLEEIEDKDFDYNKLIQFLRELNLANQNKMYLTIPLLTRSIIDHIPPIFKSRTFKEVCGSYGTKSIKQQLERLENMSRKIADSFLHTQIGKKEVLPNETQINFSNELDVLLQEIVRERG